MKKILHIFLLLFFLSPMTMSAQVLTDVLANEDVDALGSRQRRTTSDSIQSQHKEVMKGISVWTVDELTGERRPAVPDTTWYMRMNTGFAEGLYGEYNTTGNNGSPRMSRIFTDHLNQGYDDFLFVQPYSQFIVRPADFHFTNTYSPITNLDFNSCGDKITGEDHLKARFAVNAGKRLGFGFKFDYLYSLGYYQNQNTAHFGYTMWGSYLGDQYQAHLLLSTNHQKVNENGGIVDDEYILHPESFSDDFNETDIPVRLNRNWNRNDNQHVFFNQRYALGFKRRVPMTEKEIEAKKFAMASAKQHEQEKAEKKGENAVDDSKNRTAGRPENAQIAAGRPEGAAIVGDEPVDSIASHAERIAVTDKHVADSLLAVEAAKKEAEMWMKDDFVPVTSFFHTLKLDNYSRSYIAYDSPKNYYAQDFYSLACDSISDETSHLHLRNNFGVALLEGFNKYAQFGIKAYAAHELKRFTLPELDRTTNSWTENNVLVGGGISRMQGKALHFNANAEFCVVGHDAGMFNVGGNIELNFPLFKDTVQLVANGSYKRLLPSFYMRRYHSRHFWWDDEDLSAETRSHIEGILSLARTKTQLRVAIDLLQNYTYFGLNYSLGSDLNQIQTVLKPRQASDDIKVFTAQLKQDFRFGPLHWDNIVTYQTTSNKDVVPVPDLNVYTSLYLRFKIAHVLDCDFGADARYFSSYYAPEYSPQLSSYAIQENADVKVKVGNYPIVNVFANFQLKQARFFVMMSHVNYSGGGNYFLTPHHPLNSRVLRFGVNWNFFN